MINRGQTQGVRIVLGLVVAVIALFIIVGLGGKFVGLLFKAPAKEELAARNGFDSLVAELNRMNAEDVKESTMVMFIPDDSGSSTSSFILTGYNRDVVVDGDTCSDDDDLVRPKECNGKDCLCLHKGGAPKVDNVVDCVVMNGLQFLAVHDAGSFDDGPNYGGERTLNTFSDGRLFEWVNFYGDCESFNKFNSDEEFLVQDLRIERSVVGGTTYFVFSTPNYVSP